MPWTSTSLGVFVSRGAVMKDRMPFSYVTRPTRVRSLIAGAFRIDAHGTAAAEHAQKIKEMASSERPTLAPTAKNSMDVTDKTVLDQLVGALEEWVVRPNVVHRNDDACFIDRSAHPVGFFERYCHWLFQNDALHLARTSRLTVASVQSRGHADAHDIGLHGFQHLVSILEERRHPPAFAERLQLGRIRLCRRNQVYLACRPVRTGVAVRKRL